MKRDEILKSPDYWISDIQIGVYKCVKSYMEANNINRTELASHLGVSKGYISQLLNGDYNFSIKKFVDTLLKVGYVPKIDYVAVDQYIQLDNKITNTFSLDNKATYSYSNNTDSLLKAS